MGVRETRSWTLHVLLHLLASSHCTNTPPPFCGAGALANIESWLRCGALVVRLGNIEAPTRFWVLHKRVGQAVGVPPASQVAAAQADSPAKNTSPCPFSNAQLRWIMETTLNCALQENEPELAFTDLPACGAGAEAPINRVFCGFAAGYVIAEPRLPPCAF